MLQRFLRKPAPTAADLIADYPDIIERDGDAFSWIDWAGARHRCASFDEAAQEVAEELRLI